MWTVDMDMDELFSRVRQGDHGRFSFSELLHLVPWIESEDRCYKLLTSGFDVSNAILQTDVIMGYVVGGLFAKQDNGFVRINPFPLTPDPKENRRGSIIIPLYSLHKVTSYDVLEG